MTAEDIRKAEALAPASVAYLTGAITGAAAEHAPVPENAPPSASAVPPPAPGVDAAFELWLARHARNDLGNARRLVARYGCDLLFLREAGWHSWDGARWSREDGARAVELAAYATADAMYGEVAAIELAGPARGEENASFEKRLGTVRKWASGAANAKRISAMIELARPLLERSSAAMDADHFLFNVANGTLALGALEPDGTVAVTLREHRRADLITRVSPVAYDPEATDCPLWRATLDYFLPERDDQVFLQRFFGYALTGSIAEQVILLLYGAGRNGKSTIVETLACLFGDYARGIPISSLTEATLNKGGSEASPDLARLHGARLVRAAEPKRKAALAESLIKQMTGGEPLTTRHLNRGFFEFLPTFKVVVSFNRKPKISGDDDGIWRRIRLLPFTKQIPEDQQDHEFPKKLKGEGSAILNWALDGYRTWRESGLPQSRSIVQATLAFRAESDLIGPFLTSACLVTGKQEDVATAADLWTAYKAWCARNGQEPMYQNSFGRKLGERAGVSRETVHTIRYRGITLVDLTLLSAREDQTNTTPADW